MKLRTDLVLLAAAVVLLVVGLVVSAQAAFATSYVHDQLAEQKITFAPAANLTDSEKNWKPGSQCLVEYAGQPLVTGKQAECYANYFIAEHMAASAKAQGYEGETYASIGTAQSALRTEVANAKAANDTAKADEANKKLTAVTALRDTFFKGEMLRSALLTTYGFSVIGAAAETAANVSYGAAALFVVLAAIAFLRARVPAVELEPRREPGVVPAR